MGTATFVKSTTPRGAVTGTSNIKLHLDVPLLLIVLVLLAYGLVMLYSASWDFAVVHDMPATAIFIKQFRWVALGLALATGISMIDYHYYQKYILLVMGGTIGMLLLVLDIWPWRYRSSSWSVQWFGTAIGTGKAGHGDLSLRLVVFKTGKD